MSIGERGGGRAHERTNSRTEGRAHEYYSRLSRLRDGLRRSKETVSRSLTDRAGLSGEAVGVARRYREVPVAREIVALRGERNLDSSTVRLP